MIPQVSSGRARVRELLGVELPLIQAPVGSATSVELALEWDQHARLEACLAVDVGADAIIAQGWEAGGHVRGQVTTMTLVPAVVDAVGGGVPVLAAGRNSGRPRPRGGPGAGVEHAGTLVRRIAAEADAILADLASEGSG